MNENMIEEMNTINVYKEQIVALLDLMQMSESSVDIKSVNVAAEMCQTMFSDLMNEVEKIEEELRKCLKIIQ